MIANTRRVERLEATRADLLTGRPQMVVASDPVALEAAIGAARLHTSHVHGRRIVGICTGVPRPEEEAGHV